MDGVKGTDRQLEHYNQEQRNTDIFPYASITARIASFETEVCMLATLYTAESILDKDNSNVNLQMSVALLLYVKMQCRSFDMCGPWGEVKLKWEEREGRDDGRRQRAGGGV